MAGGSKYIRKSINLDQNDELTKVCAWRSIWGLRAFQFFGVDNQITKWRELRRVKKDGSAIWKAANTGNFAAYLSLLKNKDTELLKEVATNKYDEEYKKVVGISINEVVYKTHNCELLTVSVELNMVAPVVNYPREDKKYSPNNEEILTRINSPPTV